MTLTKRERERERGRNERDRRELDALIKQHPEWGEHFHEHNTLHPEERAAIEAQTERRRVEAEREIDRRIKRASKKREADFERRMKEMGERIDRKQAEARAAEPLLVERDQVWSDLRELEKRVRRWAAANGPSVLTRVAEGWPALSAMCRGTTEKKCTPGRRCAWCQAAALHARQVELWDRARELALSSELVEAEARFKVALLKISEGERGK